MARTGDNLYKRQDGRWEGRYIRDRRANGKIVYGYVYHRKFKEAKRMLFESKMAHREFYSTFGKHHSSVQPVNMWLLTWLEKKQEQLKPATYQSYESKLQNHAFPFFSETKLSELSEAMIQQWIDSLQDRLKINSIHAVFRVFRQAMKDAVDQGYLHKNPTQQTLLPRQTKSEIQAFSREDQQRIEEQCTNQKNLPILLALDTGMRIGEILGLQWRNIDWRNATITVRQTSQRVKIGEKTELRIDSPKTEASQRIIPMTKRLTTLLKELKQESQSQFIFEGKEGHPLDQRTIRYRFEQLKKQSGVEDLPFHALRHTFATRCMEAGVNITTMSALMGHSSVKLTLDIYTNSFLSEKRKAIQQLEIGV